MLTRILASFLLLTTLSCSNQKSLSKSEDFVKYSLESEAQAYTFKVFRNSKVEYKGLKGVPTEGKAKFNLPEGPAAGLWATIDDLKADKLSLYNQNLDSSEVKKRLQYQFEAKKGEIQYFATPDELKDLEKIFQALLNYPMDK